MRRPPAEETDHTDFCEEGRNDSNTHELHSIGLSVLLNEFIDVPVIHPLGYHRIFVRFQVHTEKRENIRVPQVLPSNSFSAKHLRVI